MGPRRGHALVERVEAGRGDSCVVRELRGRALVQ